MKMVKKIIIGLVLFLVIICIAGLVVLIPVKKGAIPDYDGELTLSALEAEVTVFTDERGMAHIYANSEHDVYVATGFIMARERLWQMDLIRRATRGKLSEIFGSDFVQTDLFLRSLGMTEKSQSLISEVDPEIKSIMEAFVKGVNSYIGSAGKRLAPEFRILGYKPDPWSLEDIANIIGYMGWDLASSNLSVEIFNYRAANLLGKEKASMLIPDGKAYSDFVFPEYKVPDSQLKEIMSLIASVSSLEAKGVTPFSGSNNWAASGNRTTTGKPILSNDMHLGLSMPGLWIQIHQVVPGKLNVTGVAVPGEPFVVSGHNENIAWGMTNLSVDDIDLFVEETNPDHPDQYKFDGEWRAMEVREEVIAIKGGEEERHLIRYTHRGPVVSEFRKIEGATITMKWSGFDPSNEVRAVYRLNRAADWTDFRNAVSDFRSISQNFVYADTEGNIGLNTGGGIPIRDNGGVYPRSGNTSSTDWKGYVPFDLLPFSFNPEGGTVSSANNKTVPDDYPFYITSEFSMPYRIARIRSMLNEKEELSVSDYKRMLGDNLSDYARRLTPLIVKTLNEMELDAGPEKEVARVLSDWDFRMTKDGVAPTAFEFFRIEFAANLLKDELGELYSQIPGSMRDYYILNIITHGADGWVDNITTPDEESLNDIIADSYRDAIARLTLDYGADFNKWTWGSIHKFYLLHPMGSVSLIDKIFGLNSKSYPVGGSNHTVAPYSYKSNFIVDHGASQRHIYNTLNWDDSWSVLPTGNSGVPGSPFYGSQMEKYLDGEFYPDLFSRKAVEESCPYKLVLKPDQSDK